VTVLLRVEAPEGAVLPLPLVAGYVDRFGIRATKVRVTSLDQDGARTTWVGVTLGASDNLAALQARSPELPLRTARGSARRGVVALPARDLDRSRVQWNGNQADRRRGMRLPHR
jgi:type VII secretion protein EccE